LFEGITQFHAVAEHCVVEGFCEVQYGFVFDFISMVDADNMLYTKLSEDIADKLRVARSNEHELELALC